MNRKKETETKDQAKDQKKKQKRKKPPVIRRLRLVFILAMMAIVIIFLTVIFTVQYISSERTMIRESQTALESALNSVFFSGNLPMPDDPGLSELPEGSSEQFPALPDGSTEQFPEGRPSNLPDRSTGCPSREDSSQQNFPYELRRREGERNIDSFRDRNSRTATLVAILFSDGTNIILQNDIFFINTDDVEDLLRLAADQSDETGRIADHDLRFRKRELSDSATAIAFVDISSELSLLHSDLLRSLWISLSVIAVMFVLSLFLSRLAIRPVERAWEDQRRFVADASHELKTPLTVIMSNTEMIQRSLNKLRDDPEHTSEKTISEDKLNRNISRIDHVHEESLRMKELIGELLEVARGDVGMNMADFTDISLSEVVNEAILSWESVFFEQGKTLTGEIEDELHLNGERTALRRLTEILIDNALKYSSAHSETSVRLNKEKSGSRRTLHLSVANEGTPLTADELSHLFDRFYRADSTREQIAGYGLGLSIAASIVEAHQGKIWAEADGTRGNIFHVVLPVNA